MEIESYARFEQCDPSFWPELSSLLERKFASGPLDAWLALLTPLDACISPVLSIEESLVHPHARTRDMYVDIGVVPHPAAAPRFSRTPGAIQGAAAKPGEGGLEALRRWDVT